MEPFVLSKLETKLENVLDEVLASLDKDEYILLRRIIDRWEALVGSEINYYATPRNIRYKCLYIEVKNSSWHFRLERNFKPEIQALIRRVTDQRIQRIRFVPAGKTRFR